MTRMSTNPYDQSWSFHRPGTIEERILQMKKFPTHLLVRLWFRLLWQKYDLGGISVGRSIRCNLLDCYLEYTPLPDFGQNSADDYFEGLEEELLRRPIIDQKKSPRRKVCLKRISKYSKKQVALAGLGALLAYEWSIDDDTAWRGGFEIERKRIKNILDRFQYLEFPTGVDVVALCDALLQRKQDIDSNESFANFNRWTRGGEYGPAKSKSATKSKKRKKSKKGDNSCAN